jgi:hypothetical protein
MVIMKRSAIAVVVAAIMLSACGGDGDDSSPGGTNNPPPGSGNPGGGNNNPPPPTPSTGVFIDSAVAGIHYETETQSGETDEDGRFNYLPGETVTFSLGGITLPAVQASDTVTPLMVFETNDFTDQRVVNLGRLLQSLDDDGDLTNGIQITAEARTAAQGLTIDFDVPSATFEADANITNLLSAGGGSVTLVSAEDAVSHMQDSLSETAVSLVGSWVVGEGAELITITFLPDGRYLIAEDGEEEQSGGPGYEYGTYSWDPVSGAFSVEVIADTNGDWGLSHPQGDSYKVVRDGDSFLFTELNGTTPVDETSTLTRLVPDANSPLVGTWTVDTQDEGNLALFVFLPNGHFMFAEHDPAGDDTGGPGIEHGTYSWNGETFQFAVEDMLRDTTGEWGISHAPAMTIQVEGDSLTATFAGEDETATMSRLK